MGTRAEEHDDFLVTTADGDQISTGWLVDAKSGGKDIAPGSQVRIDPEQLEAARFLAGPDGIGVLFQQLAAGQVLEIREVTREVFEGGGGGFIVSGSPDVTFSFDLHDLPDGHLDSNLPDDYYLRPSDLTLVNGSPVADKIIYLPLPDEEA